MLKTIIDFFRDPKNQHLATWVQTLAVVAGVIIALAQLSSVLEESNLKKGETLLKYESEFASDISRKMGLIYEYHVNREKLSDESYQKLYPLDQFIKTNDSIEEFISRLSACGAYGVCPPDRVDSFVCPLAKEMHVTLSRKVAWPSEWKIEFGKPIFYENKINEHCGVLERLKFWTLQQA